MEDVGKAVNTRRYVATDIVLTRCLIRDTVEVALRSATKGDVHTACAAMPMLKET